MSKDNAGIGLENVSFLDIMNDDTPVGDDAQDFQEEEDTNTGDEESSEEDSQEDSEDENQDQDQDQGNEDEQNDEGDEGSSEGEDSQEEGSDEEQVPSVVEELQSMLGYELDEEFDDSVEGIANYTKKVGAKIGETMIGNLFKKFPEVEEFLNYRAQGGDTSSYFSLQQKVNDFSNLTEDNLKNSVDLQKRTVSEMFKRMGYEDNDIAETIKDLEASDLLLKQAITSGGRLKTIATQEKQQAIQRQEEQDRIAREQQVEEWQTIGKTIKAGNLKGIQIPESEKQNFYNWMSQPIDNEGNTQRARDMQEMDTEASLALEYLYYKNFDFAKLAKSIKATSRNQGLRNRIKSKGNSTAPSKMNNGRSSGHQRAGKLPPLGEIL